MISLREGTENSMQKLRKFIDDVCCCSLSIYTISRAILLDLSADPATARERGPPVAQEGAHLGRWAGLNILNKDPRTNRKPKFRGQIPGHPLSRGHKYGERFVCILDRVLEKQSFFLIKRTYTYIIFCKYFSVDICLN